MSSTDNCDDATTGSVDQWTPVTGTHQAWRYGLRPFRRLHPDEVAVMEQFCRSRFPERAWSRRSIKPARRTVRTTHLRVPQHDFYFADEATRQVFFERFRRL